MNHLAVDLVSEIGRSINSNCNAQNSLLMFPHNFPIEGEAANLLRPTCYIATRPTSPP